MITTKPITSVACVISLRGDPDCEESGLLGDRLADLAAQGAQEIAVDLSGVSGVGSSTLLEVLREAAELLEARGGVLLVASGGSGGSRYRLARLHPRRLERFRGFHPALDAAPEARSSGGGSDAEQRTRGRAL